MVNSNQVWKNLFYSFKIDDKVVKVNPDKSSHLSNWKGTVRCVDSDRQRCYIRWEYDLGAFSLEWIPFKELKIVDVKDRSKSCVEKVIRFFRNGGSSSNRR